MIEWIDFESPPKVWTKIKCETEYLCRLNLWCTQISNNEIIIFSKNGTEIFNVETVKMNKQEDDENAKRLVPDKRGEIKKYGDNIMVILESSGNVGIYSLKEKKWNLKPHIILGL